MHVERCFYHAYLVITERHAESYTHAVEVLEENLKGKKWMNALMLVHTVCHSQNPVFLHIRGYKPNVFPLDN